MEYNIIIKYGYKMYIWASTITMAKKTCKQYLALQFVSYLILTNLKEIKLSIYIMLLGARLLVKWNNDRHSHIHINFEIIVGTIQSCNMGLLYHCLSLYLYLLFYHFVYSTIDTEIIQKYFSSLILSPFEVPFLYCSLLSHRTLLTYKMYIFHFTITFITIYKVTECDCWPNFQHDNHSLGKNTNQPFN